MAAYYNENDPRAAAWLRELISGGHIADGEVDERSILDVAPGDLTGFTQCHFFAGIGGWSYALRLAGWPDDRAVWSGSCPCFPAGTLVLTTRGLVPIEAVRVGDFVLTHRHRFQPVTHIGSDWSTTVTVRGQGHFGLVTTPEHPFYSRTTRVDRKRKSETYGCTTWDGAASWGAAENLLGRMWATVANVPTLPMPAFPVQARRGRKPNLPTRPEGDAFARFLGYWVGDGWLIENGVAICGAKNHGLMLSRLVREAGMAGSLSQERTTIRMRIGSIILGGWLRDNFGESASRKTLPSWLFGMPESFRNAFLDGYAMADGHCETQPRGAGRVRRWTTVSRALAIGVRILLNLSGVPATISFHKPNRVAAIEGRHVSELGFYRITAYESARSFRFADGHGWGRVRSVEHSNVPVQVFNLAVAEDESYTADGIVVHNCQPFSAAGKGGGFADERHLWPAWFHLIEQCKPAIVFGEQVAAPAGLKWFDLVSSDLENAGYAVAAADLCAAGVGAPHIRQRLYWVADAGHQQWGRRSSEARDGRDAPRIEPERLCPAGELADMRRQGLEVWGVESPRHELTTAKRGGATRGVVNAAREQVGFPGCTWFDGRAADWIACLDGKSRPVEPGTFPLAHGVSDRVGLLRGYGNAIVPQVAAALIEAHLDTCKPKE